MKRWMTILLACLLFLLAGCEKTNHGSSVPSSADSNPSSAGSGSGQGYDWSWMAHTDAGGLDTVGLYVWEDTPTQHDFWKACGIKTLQFCDRGWFYNADGFALKTYLNRMASQVSAAKADGFEVYIVLFSNIEQYMGPGDTEPTGIGVKFHPDDKEKLEERLFYLEKTIKALSMADGFTFFAGDPGGIPDALGKGDVNDYINMGIEVAKLVEENAPNAKFHLNTWAVAMFETPNLSAMISGFWLRETQMNQVILGREDLIGSKIGLELPCHDYYRPLTLRLYDQENTTPAQKYPQKSDIDALIARETQHIWAWPYFLLDEADDGDKGQNRTDKPEMETRYIYQYVRNMRELGFNGVIGSWSYNAYKTKCLNTYAFGRFCNDVEATPEKVIDEFSRFIATEATHEALVQVMKFIENDSNFASKLPASEQLPLFETSIQTVDEALALLQTVQIEKNNTFPLADTPENYLSNLKDRLELMR